MAALAAVLPVNVWIYAGQLQNLRSAGRKFVLQGGAHRNQGVVKAQLDFIRSKVPVADVVLHPYSGEARPIGDVPRRAALGRRGRPSGLLRLSAVSRARYCSADT